MTNKKFRLEKAVQMSGVSGMMAEVSWQPHPKVASCRSAGVELGRGSAKWMYMQIIIGLPRMQF